MRHVPLPVNYLRVLLICLAICQVHALWAQESYAPGFSLTVTATPDSICQGQSSQLNAQVTGSPFPYTYYWTPITGLSNPTIANPVASPPFSIYYKVVVVGPYPEMATDSVFLQVGHGPVMPGPVTGPQVVCQGSTAFYSVPVIPEADFYSWTVPSGCTILSGQNTPGISVRWDTVSGIVSVIAANGCGSSTPGVLTVDVVHSPVTPAFILGPETICIHSEVLFTVTAVEDAQRYTWTVPPDVEITSGQGTDSLFVIWGGTDSQISVVAENACDTSLPAVSMIHADSIPLAAGFISGPDTVCRNGSGYIYTCNLIPGATSYLWSLPYGASITQGNGANSVTLAFSNDAAGGSLAVSGKNDCGSGPQASREINVQNCSGLSETNGIKLNIWPNPASDRIFLTLSGSSLPVWIRIIDVRGMVYYKNREEISSGQEPFQINLESLSPGLYILEASYGLFSVRKKILKY